MTELETVPEVEPEVKEDSFIAHPAVSDILRPTLHDNDFLQSFVRIGLEDTTENRNANVVDEKPARSRVRKGSYSKRSGNPAPTGGRRPSKSATRSGADPKERGKYQSLSHRTVQEILDEELQLQKSKKRKRQRSDVHRMEEVYTDKDRAAAVNMGSKDIKQSLKLKRKQDRSKALQIPEEAEPSAILNLGLRELKHGDVDVAIVCINKALELGPGDKSAYIARSKCHLLLGNPQKALEDADCALEGKIKEPHNAKALFAKAEALYHLGDFELSLVYYYRGMKIRPEFDEFRLGVQKAKEAIENILGRNSVPIPENRVRLRSQALKIKPEIEKETRRKTCGTTRTGRAMPKLEDKISTSTEFSKLSTNSQERSGSIQKANSKKQLQYESNLLGQLNADKKYLQSLLKRPDVKAAHQESAKHILVHAEEGLKFLKSRQEFWRQQRNLRIS